MALCYRCGEYSNPREASPGFRSCEECRTALRLSSRKRYAAKPRESRIEEYHRYHDARREEINRKRRALYASSAESSRLKSREYRHANAERIRKKDKAWRMANRERLLLDRRARLYGLTPDQLRRLLSMKACQACNRQFGKGDSGQHIDHDHATGRVRGVLCQGCNRALGALGDSPSRIAGLLSYARRHAQLTVVA